MELWKKRTSIKRAIKSHSNFYHKHTFLFFRWKYVSDQLPRWLAWLLEPFDYFNFFIFRIFIWLNLSGIFLIAIPGHLIQSDDYYLWSSNSVLKILVFNLNVQYVESTISTWHWVLCWDAINSKIWVFGSIFIDRLELALEIEPWFFLHMNLESILYG